MPPFSGRIGLGLCAIALGAHSADATDGLKLLNNEIVRWPLRTTIQISIEDGSLGPDLPNPAIRTAVTRAAGVWNAVTTGDGRIADGPGFQVVAAVATATEDGNFDSFLETVRGAVGPARPFVLHIVIEDSTDRIVAEEGAAGDDGFTAPIWDLSQENPLGAVTVIRATRHDTGLNTDVPWDPALLEAFVVHELGHALLLDHAENPSDRQTYGDMRVPAMYPRWRRNTLAEDDRAALAFIYPRADQATAYRRVTGVVTVGGTPAVSANVIFESPEGSSYSAVTRQGDLGNTAGRYDLFVPPGPYKRYVQNIEFTGRRGPTRPRLNPPPGAVDVEVPGTGSTHDITLP